MVLVGSCSLDFIGCIEAMNKPGRRLATKSISHLGAKVTLMASQSQLSRSCLWHGDTKPLLLLPKEPKGVVLNGYDSVFTENPVVFKTS